MRILITGATGFIGSFLLTKLITEGHEIAILIRNESDDWRINEIISHCHVIYVNYESIENCEDKILSFEPELVYHIGWSGVGNDQRNNEILVTKNIDFTLALVKILLKTNVKAFIGLGSQAEYGPYHCAINESFATNPTTLYGIAKLSAYNLLNYSLRKSKIRFCWLRLFSSYGPKDNDTWLIPYLTKSISKGEKPSLTKGEQIWDYIYINDVISALLAVGYSENASGIYNLGSGIGYSLKNIITMIRDKVDPEIELGFGEIPYRNDQVMVLKADNTRLCLETGWSPETTINEGLEITINWYLKKGQ
jgi:nucleoside-diphosphate-sugar epimerase